MGNKTENGEITIDNLPPKIKENFSSIITYVANDESESIKAGTSLSSILIKNISNKDIKDIGKNGRSKETYKLNEDFLFVNPDLTTTDSMIPQWSRTPQINILNIHEFQPDYTTDLGDFFGDNKLIGELLRDIFGALTVVSSPMSVYFRQGLLNDAINLGINGRISGKDSNVAIENGSLYKVNGTDKYGNNERNFFTNNPIERIINMFDSGIWTHSYAIPYWGEDWLKSNFSKDFSANTLSKMKDIGVFSEEMQGIDYPLHPKFKTNLNENTKEISTTFYLVNHNANWLKRNYDFINCIFSGTTWSFMEKCAIKSPNVYYVECPGRFRMYWATMDVECTFEGKLRKISETEYNQYFLGYPAIDKDMLWPEYWKIKIDITDLTPNNFNLHANYLLTGDDSSEFKEFTSKSRLSENLALTDLMLESLSNVVTDMREYFNAITFSNKTSYMNDELNYLQLQLSKINSRIENVQNNINNNTTSYSYEDALSEVKRGTIYNK